MFCLQKDGTATTYIEIITPISCIEIASCWQQENLVPLYYLALLCSLVYFVLTSIWEKFSSLLKLLRSSTKGKRLPTPLATRPSTPHESTFPQASGAWTKKQHETRQGGHDGFIPVPERTIWRSSDRFDSINSISIFSFCYALWKSLISCARHGVPSPSPAGTFRFFPRIPRL